MVSTACYPYPVNETTRRAAMRPHIYSPPESHCSPRHIMYPLPHQSPSPNYIYTGHDQFYSKNSWASAPWPAFYPYPLSSSLPETTVNPKVTILPPQPLLVSDIDTPSSLSSHSILTPSSPFARHDVDEQSMDFDEFEYDDDEDYVDSDFADDMEGIDEEPPYAPHTKSTSALEGALGDSTLPADRRQSASVPYPSASRSRQSTSPAHVYTRNHASATSLTSIYAAPLAQPRLPILQPQPIRPIPPIPIAELASADDALPLLCQPVSDAIRYQLNGGLDREPTPSDLAHDGAFCHTDGTCSVGKTVYSCGCIGWR